jgi:hypothetical protein
MVSVTALRGCGDAGMRTPSDHRGAADAWAEYAPRSTLASTLSQRFYGVIPTENRYRSTFFDGRQRARPNGTLSHAFTRRYPTPSRRQITSLTGLPQ